MSAPTGAGKTVIAHHAVSRALAMGRKAIYTTPVKALSNEKYRDLVSRHGTDRVGLLTGDRRINVTAPVVVMTTEVLRALLYEGAAILEGLEVVVLDEAHFITDADRGPVWEEVVIHAPPAVRVVALSATLDEAQLLADWLSERRGPTDLVVCEERPVPLRHLYAIGRLDGSDPILLPVEVEGEPNPAAITMDGNRVRETRGEGLRKRYRSRIRPVPPPRRDLLSLLVREELVPAIWFVLSRSGCEAIARGVVEAGAGFTTPPESIELRRRADRLAAGFAAADLRALDFGGWATRFAAGVATHHGGLLPAQRELVESAFAEGLVKVAFATETLALGVNLPARTTIIDRITRSEAEGGVMAASTFAQLAGRAGRRGLDRTGVAVVPWAEEVSFLQVAALVGGRRQPLRSWFRPTPVMVANLHRDRVVADQEPVLRASLAEFLRRREIREITPERDRLAAELDRLEAHTCQACDGSAPPRDRPGSTAVSLAGEIEKLQPGDVVVDPGRRGAPPAVVVAPPRRRRGAVAVDVVRGDGRRIVMTERDLRLPPVVLAKVNLDAWISTERGHARAAASALSELELDGSAAEARRLDLEPASVATAPVCPGPRTERVRRALDDIEARIATLEEGDLPDHAALTSMLIDLGHLDDGGLTPKGEMLRRLFVPAGPVLAECLAEGCLSGLGAPDLAAVTSFFTPYSSARESGAAERHPSRAVASVWGAALVAAERVERLAAAAALPPPAGPERSVAPAIHRWCETGSVAEALAGTDLTPGDLAREARQIAELLDQISRADPNLTTAAETAQSLLLRGALADSLTAAS